MEMPPGLPAGTALFAHCFSCSKDLKAVVRISRSLAEAGFVVLRFDFTGVGESDGEFSDTNFSSNLDDLVAAAGYLRSEIGSADLLVGHSLGGAAVLAAADRIPEAKAISTIAAPSSTDYLRKRLLESAPELLTENEARIELMGRSVRIRRQLLDDLGEEHMSSGISALGRPLLIFHSPADEVVDIEHARKIYTAARHPKSFVSLDGADHLLLRRESDAVFVGAVMAAWAARYLE
jgi:putative redox protein